MEVAKIYAPPAGEKPVRVAVYARVSTDREIQQSSLSEQLRSFQCSIQAHPGWVLAGCYADEGISGTGVRKRKDFLRMIGDCEAGKIDYILTKSISRFARNTVECLSYVRRLQALGVQLYFEKEGIDTASAVSEMLLTVLAAFAQEESRSISENLKWGIRKRYAKGIGRWTPTYGYRKEKNGPVTVQPEEAQVVRGIFEAYRRGRTIPEILDGLMDTPAPRGGKWSKTSIQYLLRNEKYVGDSHLQKWISVDHITHKCIPNDTAQVPSYYVRGTHVPIVSQCTFRQVQRILELRAPHGEYCRYPYSDTGILCPICGAQMIPAVAHTQKEKRILCCFGPQGCRGYAVKSHLVDRALLAAGRRAGQEPPDKVQYYWLDEHVARLKFSGDLLRVFWRDGTSTEEPLHYSKAEDPIHVAELYRNFLNRLESGAYKPACPRSRKERTLAEGGAEP